MRRSPRTKPRGVVDTSVLVAGVAGLKPDRDPVNESAELMKRWIERGGFTWLISEDIVEEYKQVLARLKVRPQLIGRVINLLREEAEWIEPRKSRELSPDWADNPFCDCAEEGKADFIVTLNAKDFPQGRLTARVIVPGMPIHTTRRRRSKSANETSPA